MLAARSSLSFMRSLTLAFGLTALLTLASGCKGGVQHPPDGEANTPEYCADRKPEENNCMACSSQPGCGWCESPESGHAECQPGVSSETPTTCAAGWANSTEACPAPPPPPPLPASGETEPSVSAEPSQEAAP